MKYGHRVKQAMELREMKPSELSKALQIKSQDVNGIINRGSRPRDAELRKKIVSLLKVRAEWLDTGEEPMEPMPQGGMLFYEKLEDLPPIDDMITVDYPADFGMAAGSGVSNSEFQNIRSMPFYLGTLKKGDVKDPNKVIVGCIKGASNEAVIPNGTAVGIDLGSTQVIDDEIYLITIDGEERLKQIISVDDGIMLRSLNKDKSTFPDEIVNTKELLSRGMLIRGRLWWVSWVNPIGHIKKLLKNN